MNFARGDLVIYEYGKEKYRGIIKDIVDGEYLIEICTNKKKSEENEVEVIRASKSQVRSFFS